MIGSVNFSYYYVILLPLPKKLAIGVMKITGCVWPGGIRSVPSSACLWRAVDILLACTATKFPPTPLITGWKTVRFSNRDTMNSSIRPPQLLGQQQRSFVFTLIVGSCLLFLVYSRESFLGTRKHHSNEMEYRYSPADQHGNHYRSPSGVKDIVGVLVSLGDPYPERRDEDVASNHQGRNPILLIYRFVENRRYPRE